MGSGEMNRGWFGDTPMMAAVLVIGAIGFLFAIERGFRGIKIG